MYKGQKDVETQKNKIANNLTEYKLINPYRTDNHDQSFFDKFKFQVNNILKGEKIRMISAGFLHVDWLHLGFNMYALYLFGDIVHARMGTIAFLIIYFGSLLTGSLYSLTFHKKELYYSAVGASGAVSGIVFSCIMLYPQMQLGF